MQTPHTRRGVAEISKQAGTSIDIPAPPPRQDLAQRYLAERFGLPRLWARLIAAEIGLGAAL